MKFFIILTLVMLAAVLVLETGASPLGDIEVKIPDSGTVVRTKRATCDLFSALGVEDSLCAAHCLVMGKGFRGGHCVNGVCVCRK